MASPYDSYPIDTARLRKVVELVADKGGWGTVVPKGHGLGIAVHRSLSATSRPSSRSPLTTRASSRCPGRHRDRLRNLCQSGTHRVADRGRCDHGAESCQYGEITFKDGKVQQGNFDDFPVIRMDESPVVTNVYIVPPGPDTPPSGVGGTRRAAVRAGVDQRDLRRHRKAHPELADRQATGGVTAER